MENNNAFQSPMSQANNQSQMGNGNNQMPPRQPMNNQPMMGPKKKMWKWLLILVIVAIVVYGLAYYGMGLMQGVKTSNNQNQQQGGLIQDDSYKNATVVSITKDGFNPATLTVKKGTVVKWVNNDDAKHTMTADQEGPKSPELKKGDSYSAPFNTVGTFSYHCALHAGMKGKVVVTE